MDQTSKSDFLSLIKGKYDFRPIPDEGGLFHQTYISEDSVNETKLRGPIDEERSINSTGYFLLEDSPDCFSALHKLKSDETYHFYQGDPIELLMLHPDGTAETVTLGMDIRAGHSLQYTVKAGDWQGSHLVQGGKYALLAVSMSPGFHPADFELGNRQKLTASYPAFTDLIFQLTR
ncbi:MAG: cupin domain-containing protein [Anaerolineaceae bacterium]|jgi:hypothetical protein